MKKILIILFFVPVIGWGQGAYYDESKHYQFRAMEDGPWEFKPESYYYSWIRKKVLWWHVKVPGLGAHDKGPAGIGTGDRYVSRYSPNGKLRAATIAVARLEKDEYDKQADKYDKVKNMEALLSADRTVDAVKISLKDRMNRLQKTFINNITIYIGNKGDKEKALTLWNQYYAIMESIGKINAAYLDNSKRLKAYQVEMEKMGNLNAGVAALIKLQYHRNSNSNAFNVNRFELIKKYYSNIKL